MCSVRAGRGGGGSLSGLWIGGFAFERCAQRLAFDSTAGCSGRGSFSWVGKSSDAEASEYRKQKAMIDMDRLLCSGMHSFTQRDSEGIKLIC